MFRPLIDDVVLDVKTPLIVLLCAVGCMLLIACLNVSNLLVARGASRRKEVAVRGALGGSRLTLIREQMTESLLICVAGGSLGLLLSLLSTRWLASHWRDLPRAESIHLDGTVLTFSIALSVSRPFWPVCYPPSPRPARDFSRLFRNLLDRSVAARRVPRFARLCSLRKFRSRSFCWYRQDCSSRAFFTCGRQTWLCDRRRADHQIRASRETIRYAREGHCVS